MERDRYRRRSRAGRSRPRGRGRTRRCRRRRLNRRALLNGRARRGRARRNRNAGLPGQLFEKTVHLGRGGPFCWSGRRRSRRGRRRGGCRFGRALRLRRRLPARLLLLFGAAHHQLDHVDPDHDNDDDERDDPAVEIGERPRRVHLCLRKPAQTWCESASVPGALPEMDRRISVSAWMFLNP